jgi:hypothetical protein
VYYSSLGCFPPESGEELEHGTGPAIAAAVLPSAETECGSPH